MAENVIALSVENVEQVAGLVLRELVGKRLLVIQGDRQSFTQLEMTPWGKQVWVSSLKENCLSIAVNTVHFFLVYPVPAVGPPPVLFIFNSGEVRVVRTVNDQRSETVYKVVIEHLAPSGRPLRNVYQVIGPLE